MKLSEIQCESWGELLGFIKTNQLPLLLSTDDKRCVQAAKNCKKFGERCAAAIICAELYIERNRASCAAHWALSAYKEIAPERKEEWKTFWYWLAWSGIPNGNAKWPIKPEFADDQEKAGLANVMFRLAMEKMLEGTTSEQLAASKIFEFLEKGMKNEIQA